MNQHYVPRCYLKNFASKKRRDYFVEVYDKIEDRFFQANIKKVCSEIDIYTLREGNTITDDLLVIEKIYANGLEPLYLKAYDLLTNHNINFISQLQRIEILIAIFQLYIRNPLLLKRVLSFHEKEINSLWEEAHKRGNKGLTYQEEDFSFKDWTKDSIINFFVNKVTNEFKEKHVNGVGTIGDFHQHAIIEINIIDDESEFITSDNPLILEDSLFQNDHPLLKSKEFFVALNRKVALRLYHDNTKAINRIYRLIIPNASVEMVNKSIINQSSRFIMVSKEKFDIHNKIAKDFLDNTSLELKIDMIRQILTKFPADTPEKDASTQIMKEYLKRYETNGTLTSYEVYEMHLKLKKITSAFIQNRIT